MKKLVSLLAALMMVLAVAGAGAETNYPNGPITVIVAASAGGDSDVNCRLLAVYLSEALGQNIVIQNVTGAGGAIAAQQMMSSKPDGYTAIFWHNSVLLNEITGISDIKYTDMKVANMPLLDKTAILVARTNSGWKDLSDLVAAAKAEPGKYIAGMETGTLAHLVPLAVENVCGIDLNIVDVGTAAERLTNLLGGQIDFFFAQYGVVKDYIASGDLMALCALTDERNDKYPDVPTAKELGYDLAFDKFFYFGFPKDTPDAVVDVFNAAVEKVCQNQEMLNAFDKLYLVPSFRDGEAAQEVMAETYNFYNGYKDLLK